jgi:hypothetical protein
MVKKKKGQKNKQYDLQKETQKIERFSTQKLQCKKQVDLHNILFCK